MSALPAAEDTKTRLLDAAGQVFAESGFQGATVREICTRAGANVALVNYYFGDKQALYGEVLHQAMGSMQQEREALESGLPPAQAVREMIRAAMQRIYRPNRPAWHYPLMVQEMTQPTAAMNEVVESVVRPIYTGLRRVIAEMLGLPVDSDKVRYCAHSIYSQLAHYAQSKKMTSSLWPELELTPERISEISDHIADFSLAYLEKAAEAAAQEKTKAAKFTPGFITGTPKSDRRKK